MLSALLGGSIKGLLVFRSRAARPFCLALVTIALLQAGDSWSAPIVFVHQGVANGSLDGTPFSSSLFVIVAHGDTDERHSFAEAGMPGPGWWIDHSDASISIVGVGDFEILTSTRTFVNDTLERVGFSRSGGGGLDLFNGPNDAVLGQWDMRSSIGPLEGAGELFTWAASPQVVTSGGVLIFNDGTSEATFTAVVPESEILSLFAIFGSTYALRRARNSLRAASTV